MSLTPDGRRRILRDFEKSFKYAKQSTSPDWLLKVETLTAKVITYAKQICQSGGATTEDKRKALRETVFTTLLQEFDSLTKEELLFFSTTQVADAVMSDVEASPWGSDKPDLLS